MKKLVIFIGVVFLSLSVFAQDKGEKFVEFAGYSWFGNTKTKLRMVINMPPPPYLQTLIMVSKRVLAILWQSGSFWDCVLVLGIAKCQIGRKTPNGFL